MLSSAVSMDISIAAGEAAVFGVAFLIGRASGNFFGDGVRERDDEEDG